MRVLQSEIIGTGIERYQRPAEVCKACKGVKVEEPREWCYSDDHPTYVAESNMPQLRRLINEDG